MKFTTKICTFLMCVLIGLSLCVTSLEAGVVSYDGGAQEFIFRPGTKESPTNLFANFQSVMPGDSLTEQIVIKNVSSNHMDVEVYLRSKGVQEGTEAFLSRMKLTVKQVDGGLLFEAPANESAQLSDWVHLGTVHAGGEITLDVTLEVPMTMGNEFQKSSAYMDWEFRVDEVVEEETEEDGGKDDNSNMPPVSSGDSSHILQYTGCTGVSLLTLLILIYAAKKQKICRKNT